MSYDMFSAVNLVALIKELLSVVVDMLTEQRGSNLSIILLV